MCDNKTYKNLETILKFQEKLRKRRKRNLAFEILKNKNLQREIYSRTKPCNNVKKLSNGDYTKCDRYQCKFAHWTNTWKIPECLFDLTCKKINCGFKHSSETPNEWFKKTGKSPPDLPIRKKKSNKIIRINLKLLKITLETILEHKYAKIKIESQE